MGVPSSTKKIQQTVALSSTEAEFAASSDAGKYALYIRSILEDLDESQESLTVLYIDNVLRSQWRNLVNHFFDLRILVKKYDSSTD